MGESVDIKLITYSRTRNYGGILQAYGLFRYLQLQRYKVSFIDYIPRRCNIGNKKEFVDEAVSKSKVWGMNSVTKWLFSIIRYPAMEKSSHMRPASEPILFQIVTKIV